MVETVAEWRVDPFGRHEHRYWDGAQWTEHVADLGRTATDPVPASDGAMPPPPPVSPGVPTFAQTPATGATVYVVQSRNNGLAIASMVLGIVWLYWVGSILAVIFGHIALSQIKKSGDAQRGR